MDHRALERSRKEFASSSTLMPAVGVANPAPGFMKQRMTSEDAMCAGASTMLPPNAHALELLVRPIRQRLRLQRLRRSSPQGERKKGRRRKKVQKQKKDLWKDCWNRPTRCSRAWRPRPLPVRPLWKQEMKLWLDCKSSWTPWSWKRWRSAKSPLVVIKDWSTVVRHIHFDLCPQTRTRTTTRQSQWLWQMGSPLGSCWLLVEFSCLREGTLNQ